MRIYTFKFKEIWITTAKFKKMSQHSEHQEMKSNMATQKKFWREENLESWENQTATLDLIWLQDENIS